MNMDNKANNKNHQDAGNSTQTKQYKTVCILGHTLQIIQDGI